MDAVTFYQVVAQTIKIIRIDLVAANQCRTEFKRDMEFPQLLYIDHRRVNRHTEY